MGAGGLLRLLIFCIAMLLISIVIIKTLRIKMGYRIGLILAIAILFYMIYVLQFFTEKEEFGHLLDS